MGRAGYSDDVENDWNLIMYRGSVKSALRGKRGQAFLKELVAALDRMPEKKLVAGNVRTETGEVCALGAVAVGRGMETEPLEEDFENENHSLIAKAFGIAEAMAREIVYENDECGRYVADGDKWRRETDEERWQRMRAWAEGNILNPVPQT